MNVTEAVENRVSCRGFKKEPVEQSILQEIFSKAQQSPSNCNVQPWKV
jgi:nitroreductase